jgi:hypothetical protein
MFTQFRRLLDRIAESNEKFFARDRVRMHTINSPHYGQMGKLSPVRIVARPCRAQDRR